MKGNEEAVGYDIINEDRDKEAVQRSIEENLLIISNPVELVQGGKAIIGRLPIFISDRLNKKKPHDKFWGFAVIIVDFDALLHFSGISNQTANGLQLAFRSGRENARNVFHGSDLLFETGIVGDISLPDENWQVAAIPVGGWNSGWRGRPILIIIAFGIWLLTVLVIHLQWKINQSRIRERDLATAANQAKSTFLANMSHEIRTPINAVIGYTYLGLQKNPTPQIKSYLQKVQASTYTLLNLINDVLDISKIEANRLELEQTSFALQDVFSDLANIVALQAAQKHLELVFHVDKDIPGQLVGDSMRLGQILANLTNNAVKFTDAGEVVVSVEAIDYNRWSDEGTITLKFSISDTGIGIDPDRQNELFEPFTQADTSTTRRFGGTGLGLSICKELIEKMGGNITLISKPGQGSRFEFSLVFDVTREEANEYCPLVRSHGIRALVVDDNESVRIIMDHTLQEYCQDVAIADSGEAALEILEQANQSGRKFDVIILDWKMPGLDGIDVSKRINAMYPEGEVPALLMITAYDQEDVRGQALDAGIQEFLIKPVNPSTLLQTLSKMVGADQTMVSIGHKEDRYKLSDLKEILKGACVLVVDDNHSNQEILVELLESISVRVLVADNGREALDRLSNSSIDLVLMDIQMPVMDGLQATSVIRRDNAFRSLPIIALTAHALDEDRERCFAVGMNGHLSKPVDPEQLYQTLVRWVGQDGAHLTFDVPSREIQDTSGLPSTLPGIDIKAGLSVIAGNTDKFRRLVVRFSKDHIEAVKTIEAAITTNDADRIATCLHSLKGAAANVGANRLADLTRSMEKLVGGGAGPDALRLQLSGLERELAKIRESANLIERTAPATKSGGEQFTDSQTGFTAIKEMLIKNQHISADQISNIEMWNTSPDQAADIDSLVAQIGRFDYKSALVSIDRILEKSI